VPNSVSKCCTILFFQNNVGGSSCSASSLGFRITKSPVFINLSIIADMQRYLIMSLICISFMTNDAECLFMSLFAIHMCSFVHILSPIISGGVLYLFIQVNLYIMWSKSKNLLTFVYESPFIRVPFVQKTIIFPSELIWPHCQKSIHLYMWVYFWTLLYFIGIYVFSKTILSWILLAFFFLDIW